MRWSAGFGSALLVFAAGCSGVGSAPDTIAASTSSIQGGSDDPSHPFAVGVIEQNGRGFAICSGALLAPNLVATARHCVSHLASSSIDCATSSFGAVTAASNLFVTTDAVIGTTMPYDVARIVVPSGANQASVCGNDLALLILAKPIALAAYVTPAITPPITNHITYSTNMAAIGYGITSPGDTSGASAGTRRIRQGIGIVCIPNDPTYALNCYKTDPTASQYVTANEFVGGDGTCEGDSGSSAFDQASFNQGKWVSFGVLSRGGLSAEGGTCSGSIYTRFDAWASLLTSTAIEAAAMGGYAVPSWAGAPSPTGGPAALPDGSASAPPDGSASAPPSVCAASGTSCITSTDCCSNNCLSLDRGITFKCVACDCANPCDTGLVCRQRVCVSGAPAVSCPDGSAPITAVPATMDAGGSAAAPNSGGCTCTMTIGSRPSPWRAVGVAASAALIASARRRRHRPGQLSGTGHAGRGKPE
ncbi:MAG: trypsin-like serine protease [Myxococcota bacterium]|nr:trypsin-like serine protease [Myxococcota bacterium]